MAGERVLTASAEETRTLGRRIGAGLRGGEVVTLHGPLGAGKSVLARGIGEALRASDWRGSPTFNLVHEYRTTPALVHADLYRLAGIEVEGLGLEEYARPDSVLVVEWPERAEAEIASLPAERRIAIALDYAGEDERAIEISEVGAEV